MFEIRYRPGKQNANADALSRSPVLTESSSVQEVPDDELTAGVRATRVDQRWQRSELRAVQQRNEEIRTVMDQLEGIHSQPEPEGQWRENGFLRRYRQLWS